MDMRLKCQTCGEHTSTKDGKRYRGKLVRCAKCLPKPAPEPRECEHCKRLVSPLHGILYRGKLVKCAECKKPALSLLEVKVLSAMLVCK